MRLCRIATGSGRSELAFYFDEYVVPLSAVYDIYWKSAYGSQPLFPCPGDDPLPYLPPNWANYALLSRLAKLAETAARDESARCRLDRVKLDTPIPMPHKVICLAVNYAEHATETGGSTAAKAESFPFFFMKPPSTTVRPSHSCVALPSNSPDAIDWEVELTAVIGTYAKDVTVEEARAVVGAYTVGLDMSNRRLRLNPGRVEQERTAFHEWLCGKWHDGFAPIGPCIVPADNAFDPGNRAISLSVNGRTMQDSNTSHMIFDVYELVSYASRIMTLEPGDIIMTGTPSGVGMARNCFLKRGDEITASVEGIGTLRATIV
jgi:2,4-diketo-3-deoxy-L-fuconate hydrolase